MTDMALKGEPLKAEKRVVFMVDAYDLGAFIEQELGKPIEIPAALESGNDTSHEFTVKTDNHFNMETKKYEYGLDKWDTEDVENFLSTGAYSFSTPSNLMNYLCMEGKLEAGEYVVRVSW